METTYPQKVMKASELQLADVVRMQSAHVSEWSTCIVKSIENGEITLFRPYGMHADWSCTGGVICYIGLEQYKVRQDSGVQFYVYRRTNLR